MDSKSIRKRRYPRLSQQKKIKLHHIQLNITHVALYSTVVPISTLKNHSTLFLNIWSNYWIHSTSIITFVSIFDLVDENRFFSWLLVIGENIEWVVMRRQFVSFKEFVRPQTKVASSSGTNILLDCLSF